MGTATLYLKNRLISLTKGRKCDIINSWTGAERSGFRLFRLKGNTVEIRGSPSYCENDNRRLPLFAAVTEFIGKARRAVEFEPGDLPVRPLR